MGKSENESEFHRRKHVVTKKGQTNNLSRKIVSKDIKSSTDLAGFKCLYL